jgi:hypothetical protein
MKRRKEASIHYLPIPEHWGELSAFVLGYGDGEWTLPFCVSSLWFCFTSALAFCLMKVGEVVF